MQEIDVENWEGFEARLREIRQAEIVGGKKGSFLYRGLSDSAWPLATTLERHHEEEIQISQYYQLISAVKPQIETFTGTKWNTRGFPEVEKLLREHDTVTLLNFPSVDEYGYMAYLRHHGFPSPLLDWSHSQYVAGYFAFRCSNKPTTEKVSIYVYSDSPSGYKTSTKGVASIRRTGPYVRTHRRHFLQQSDYTLCVIFRDAWCFARHGDVFALGSSEQDVLWKLNIPWSERLKVLKLLDVYNLNALSLFDSEEALMETMALRELDFKAILNRSRPQRLLRAEIVAFRLRGCYN